MTSFKIGLNGDKVATNRTLTFLKHPEYYSTRLYCYIMVVRIINNKKHKVLINVTGLMN